MQNILITGSKGFIGSSLISYLKNEYNIFECDTLINKPVLSIDNNYIIRNNIECIIHLAAQTSVWNNDLIQIEEDNIKSFMHIFLLAKKHNIKFIYASSSCSVNITSMYGLSKYFDDEFVKMYNYDKCICLRFHNVYGKNSRKDTLCGICLNNDTIALYNNGNNYRHFTHIDDVCYSIKYALENIDKGNYNILNEDENSTLEFCQEIAKYKDLQIILDPTIRELDKEILFVDKSYPNLILTNYTNIKNGILKTLSKI